MIEEFYDQLKEFKDSDIPEHRLFYKQNFVALIRIGEKLHSLEPNEELKEKTKKMREFISKYKIYPKLNNEKTQLEI